MLRRRHEAIGLLIDGHQLQIAHLVDLGDRVVLQGVERATLVEPLQLGGSDGDVFGLDSETTNVLGLAEDAEEEVPSEDDVVETTGAENEAQPTNASIIHDLLLKFPLQHCTLGVSLLHGCVHFVDIPETSGLTGRQLRRHIMQRLHQERVIEPEYRLDERHGYIETGENQGLSIVREDPLEILGILDDLSPFIGKAKIGVIDPIEVTLMNVARLGENSGTDVVVFVGEDHSRLIFMQDGAYYGFSRPINEGFRSPNLPHTISRRILFEQDVSEISEIGRIRLAGESLAGGVRAQIEEAFPDARVEYLSVEALELSPNLPEEPELVSVFAVPIGLAWKALRPAEPTFYPTNFLPRTRRRQQNPLEIAWHGLVLTVLLAASVLLLGLRAQEQARTIDQLSLAVELLEEEIEESRHLVAEVRDQQQQIDAYNRNFALIDSLAARKHTWSDRIRQIAETVRSTGRIWLTHVSTTEGGIDVKRDLGEQVDVQVQDLILSGVTTDPTRVAKLAESLGSGNIESIERTKIREARVHAFRLKAPTRTRPERVVPTGGD